MAKPPKYEGLDSFDSAIVDLLAKEGRLTITEISNRIGLSVSPCKARFKRLVDEGYILGFHAALSPTRLKREHVAFTTIRLTDTTEKGLQEFNKAVMDIPEIETCHMIAGDFDYLIKVRTADPRSYRRVLGETISCLPNVGSTSTFFSMESVKDKL